MNPHTWMKFGSVQEARTNPPHPQTELFVYTGLQDFKVFILLKEKKIPGFMSVSVRPASPRYGAGRPGQEVIGVNLRVTAGRKSSC